MPLTTGTRLGPYEILVPIGAGGMGEVYKARDKRLDRLVAVKVLSEHISRREDSRARFEREARTVASLNHPNICTLFDIGHQDGTVYLVMELLEGETLAARVKRGAIGLETALVFATQIADALDRAHRAGVTHRDVKPGNIMLTRDGVKVLDFGLAKSTAKSAPTQETLTAALTVAGTVVGTPQYMAPEQFEGKEADARSDVWALGAVLYEMVTGQKAFQGKSYSTLVGAILSADPPPMSVKPFTPSWLERLVRRCLNKDPEDRYFSMHDLVLDLRAPVVENAAPAKASYWPWAVAACLATALAASWAIAHFHTHEEPQIRSFFLAPANASFRCLGDDGGPAVLSPDGKRLAFAATTTDGKVMLWTRSLDSTTAQPVSGTEGAMFPFWSPNSRSIGFFADAKLKKVDATGGAVTVLADAPATRGGAWNRDDVILFSPRLTSAIFRTTTSGGSVTPVTRLDPKQQEISHRWPSFLPDGRHFLYTSRGHGVFVASLDSSEKLRRLLEESSNAQYSAGFLLYSHENTLLARPFDIARMQFTGAPEVLAHSVQAEVTSDRACFSGSETGLLAYHAGLTETQLTWFDRSGHRIGAVGEPGLLGGVELAPDGKQAAVVLSDASGGATVWIYEVDRGIKRRFSSADPVNLSLLWSRDSRRLAIGERRAGAYVISEKDTGGIGGEELLFRSSSELLAGNWSPDGGLTLITRNENSGWDIDYLPPKDKGRAPAPVPVLHGNADEMSALVSPDGRWIFYVHSEPGDIDMYPYIAAFPGGGQRRQISPEAAGALRWNRNGKEIFYVSHNKLMAADVRSTGGTLEMGAPHMLFQIRGDCNYMYVGSCFDVASDGRRFLVTESIGPPPPVALIQNWTAALKK